MDKASKVKKEGKATLVAGIVQLWFPLCFAVVILKEAPECERLLMETGAALPGATQFVLTLANQANFTLTLAAGIVAAGAAIFFLLSCFVGEVLAWLWCSCLLLAQGTFVGVCLYFLYLPFKTIAELNS